MIYKIDDTVITKKKHVCGSNEWKVTRIGIEIKLECCKCGREIFMFKKELDSKVKSIKSNNIV
ncbi:MAG: DUF951 domain-containing protein [Acholeplasmataceae bacterium]